MSAVVEAIKGVVDFAGDVVEGVLDDPLTAIATAAAFSFGMPFLGLKAGALAAGVANTAAGLVQGEEFDEAIKGGVMAGVTSWAGGKIAGGFGDDAAAAAADDVAAAKAANMADEFGSNYSGTAQSTLPKTAGPSSGYTGGTQAPSFDASRISGSGSSWSAQNAATGLGDDLLNVKGAGTGDWASVSAKTGLGDDLVGAVGDDALTAGGMQKVNYAAKNVSQYADEGAGAAGRSAPIEGAGTVTHGSSYTGPQNYVNVVDDAGNVGTNVKSFDVVQNTGGQNLAANPTPNISNQFNPLYSDAGASAAGTGYNIIDAAKNELLSYADDVVGYGGKAIDWAAAHPIATTAGVAGTGMAVDYLMDKMEEGDREKDRRTEEQKRMQEKMAEAEKKYYEPLPQYTLKRKLYIPEVSQEDLYGYGESPEGEYRFYSDSIYEPYTGYQEGGSVMPQAPSKVNPAFAFYKYGNVPNSVRRYEDGGYAEGGSRGDGRSDHIEALLSPGEFVMDAETVALLGNGSSEAGARRLEEMRKAVRKQKGGALSKGKFSPDAKSPLSYLSKKR